MSRFGAKKGPRMPGAEFTFDADPGREPVNAPTPLYPVCLDWKPFYAGAES
jgi:DNA-directed RNA polymerase III subunit RPC7